AWGDHNLLRQVWINIISNAIKYSSGRNEPVVEIGVKYRENRPVYYVKDNGAGFNMKYADKLFGVFQRLHRQDEFSGTGVGLALVQRIILRHGGTIWAEAVEQEGATFYFSLPGQRSGFINNN
ncbi:MAG TPA: ATP-binding protein, partial [Ferruginibacter sp.]|nr:ATP-binding protein [Ferruginibacter sp.]